MYVQGQFYTIFNTQQKVLNTFKDQGRKIEKKKNTTQYQDEIMSAEITKLTCNKFIKF